VLTADQARALRPIEEAIDRGGFAPFLLFGVTGSGKTEIYQSAIDRVIAQGREAIVLVPEISLTPQTIRRFRARFDQVAVLHSHMTDAERHRHWRSIAAGEAKVVVGARSAVFAPARNLGLIVVDEEHEPSFKQEITPRYQGRDAAVKRASLLGIPVILGSATPSLESWRNAQLGRYHLLELDRRVAERPMPDVSIVDLRLEPPPPPGTAAWGLSRPLSLAIDSALADDGQVMLLLNRRGYHRFVLCPSCGEVLTCPSCDVAMTHHRERRRVVCHMCETERALPESCRNCGQARLYFGGLGTERLEREVRSAFPDRVVRRMDSDTMRTRGSHERVLREFREGKIDILLGTQMIAKGLDFPDVTLVGVVDADTALHLPDFRAAERTFQLVAQVAGRAGRGHRPGRVIVQTYSPEQAAIRFAAAHDYRGFASEELVRRQQHAVPPFSRLARILARGRDAVATENALQTLVDQLTRAAPRSVRILGPAIAPIARIRNQHRFHAQLQAPDPKPLHDVLCKVWPEFDPPSDVEISIDIDPVQML
jgi:primosomal protein N' (replication factor Y)